MSSIQRLWNKVNSWHPAGQVALGFGVIVVIALVVGGIRAATFLRTDDPETYTDIVEHYKYGSIGSEASGGIPYLVWRVLPEVFPEYLPDRPGDGYERFGFVMEPGHDRPIGTSVRKAPVPLIAVNCAACHTGTVRTSDTAQPMVVLGMPAQQLDFLAYQRFFIDCARDDRFNGDTLIAAIKRIDPSFSHFDELLYRYYIIPRLKSEILSRYDDFKFLDNRPDWGPGRVDTFSPYKVHFGFDMTKDTTIGVADLPTLWNQAVREGMSLHWDGNNTSLAERNISAALGAGATEDSLDHPSLQRVADWIKTLPPPAFPGPIDQTLAAAGKQIYEQRCATCHDVGGAKVGQVEPLTAVGTDPSREESFNPAIAEKMDTYGKGYPWHFTHFRDTDGYANMPLDGVWLRAPYLHNGSVPTLRDLLKPPDQRPKVFYRGIDLYDMDNLGFVSSGAEAEKNGFKYDTSLPGNGNGGHVYGTDLTDQQVDALIEYLKTR
jgi:mono/diheme cytochrome c family protein